VSCVPGARCLTIGRREEGYAWRAADPHEQVLLNAAACRYIDRKRLGQRRTVSLVVVVRPVPVVFGFKHVTGELQFDLKFRFRAVDQGSDRYKRLPGSHLNGEAAANVGPVDSLHGTELS